MALLPDFTADGLLPPGNYELTLNELRQSRLVVGAGTSQTWAGRWRAKLVDGLETLVTQLWSVGVGEVFVDGSFAEDKAMASGPGIPTADSPTVGIRRSNYLCGTGIGWSCTHTSLGSWRCATNLGSHTSSRRRSDAAVVEAYRRESLCWGRK